MINQLSQQRSIRFLTQLMSHHSMSPWWVHLFQTFRTSDRNTGCTNRLLPGFVWGKAVFTILVQPLWCFSAVKQIVTDLDSCDRSQRSHDLKEQMRGEGCNRDVSERGCLGRSVSFVLQCSRCVSWPSSRRFSLRPPEWTTVCWYFWPTSEEEGRQHESDTEASLLHRGEVRLLVRIPNSVKLSEKEHLHFRCPEARHLNI